MCEYNNTNNGDTLFWLKYDNNNNINNKIRFSC
jgi:hypothetical protein